MLPGVIFGLVFSILIFTGVGHPPMINVGTIGPFKNGLLYFLDYHIHHWIFCGIFAGLARTGGFLNIFAFFAIVSLAGLMYPDSLDF